MGKTAIKSSIASQQFRRSLTLILCAFAAACGSACLPGMANGQDYAGVWRGKWTADATARRSEHGGPLRMKLTPAGPNTYAGVFSGRFAKVIPYFYRADVYQSGSHLYSSKKLGPMGEYRMSLQLCPNCDVSGRWNAGKHNGSIQLRRRR